MSVPVAQEPDVVAETDVLASKRTNTVFRPVLSLPEVEAK